MSTQQFLITGGSGFIGSRLISVLLDEGHKVTVLTRNPTKTAQQFDNKVAVIDNLELLQDDVVFDVVINLAGQGIVDKRWNETIKKQIRDSRLNTTQALIIFLQRVKKKPELLISGSAIGYYGVRGDERVDEQDTGDNSFSSILCTDWEREASHAESLGIRICYLRTGIVLGKNGGALAKMLTPFKMGLGGSMGDGKQWMSWVHVDDLIGIILHTIEHQEIQGAINGTAPNPVNNKNFTTTLGKALNRPTLLPMPAFVLKLMMGEMVEELLLSGQRVMPVKVIDAGYIFQYPELEEALRDTAR